MLAADPFSRQAARVLDVSQQFPGWQPERYRDLLHVLVRRLELDRRFRRRFSASDIVQEALLKACALPLDR